MHDSDYEPARRVLEIVMVSLTPTNIHPNSSAHLTSSRLVYRLGMKRAAIPFSHAVGIRRIGSWQAHIWLHTKRSPLYLLGRVILLPWLLRRARRSRTYNDRLATGYQILATK